MAGSYLLLVILAIVGTVVSKPDAMSILASMFLTMPWSFWLLETLPEGSLAGGGRATFFLLLFLCAVVNALILYVFGLLITKIISLFRK